MRNLPSWWVSLLLVLATAAIICAPPAAASTQLRNKTHLTIGYLTTAKGIMEDRQGLSISGALTLALEQINEDPDILPDVHLDMVWNDTRGETVKATKALTDMLYDGVVAFFGPEGSCYVEAIITQAHNKPMMSYKCSDHKASSVPTFVRTQPPDTQITKSVISLLKYYSWTKFSIVYEKYWENIALLLEDQAKNNNMKINHKKLWVDKHICCRDNMTCCQPGYSYQFVTETKHETRIYVFLGNPISLVDIMQAMHAAQLFEDGHYMVIYVDRNEYSDKESKRYLWKPDEVRTNSNCTNHEWDFYKRGRSLFVIVSTPPMQNYQDFKQNVSIYNAQEPFKFQTSKFFLSHNYTDYISIYAAYLYDSVQLYAKALDQLLKEQSTRTNLTEDIIREIANNGTKIVETIIKNRTYKSVTGATIKLDNNGDSEGNFSVLALQKSEFREVNFTCDYYLKPVGQFNYGEGELPQFKRKANTKIDWQSNSVPLDEPICGFSGKLCP